MGAIYRALFVRGSIPESLRMPVTRGHDSKGPFYRFGKHGAKYRYTAGNAASRARARAKAVKQGSAVEASLHRGGRAAPRRRR